MNEEEKWLLVYYMCMHLSISWINKIIGMPNTDKKEYEEKKKKK